MYTEKIPFEDNDPLRIQLYKIDEYPLHCHEDAIEIIFVLKGTVKVKVSFEYFTLSEGDYVVVNKEDSHKIWRHDKRDNMVAVFQISLLQYRSAFPHIDYVLFACESFDLAKYKGHTTKLRQCLLSLIDNTIKGGEEEATKEITDGIMDTLVREYSLERYYNRQSDISDEKLAIYYKIVQYIYENYTAKTILEDIARESFYSKSYISHLFKEVGAASFQEILGYIRVYKAERLLLESDYPLAAISERCGFSDIKYLNQTFKKWFQIKPSAYRRNYQNQIGKEVKVKPVSHDKAKQKLEALVNLADDDDEYKVCMTPITLKNIGSKTDLLHCLNQNKSLNESEAAATGKQAGTSYAVIRIGADEHAEDTKEQLKNFLEDFCNKASGEIEYWFIK
ncbi:AraC family transcriptional regulator [Azotosporobacter soli]|uniref:AraC family transcriptional regulator n=1 Tax=Azotosporobacter soli TaxID=3055040 RepID=UPI0031FF1000